MADYILALRKLVGKRKLIHPGVRVLVENDKGEFLFIRRTDNGNWGIPAGGFEENESIVECAKREVLEETGLELLDVQLIGISSQPFHETVEYPNGDQTQYLSIEFYSNQWTGQLKTNPQETLEVVFKPLAHKIYLPLQEQRTFEHLAQFKQEKRVIVE